MIKYKLRICMLLFIILISNTAFAYEKGLWYIGFGLGSGQGWINTDNKDYTFEKTIDKIGDANNLNFSNPLYPLATNIGIGGIITSKFHLGVEYDHIMQTDDDDGITYTIRAYNVFLVGTFFPFEKGLSFKIGGGYSWFNEEIFGGLIDDFDNNIDGYGGLIGIGYDFNFGSNFNLGLHVDYTYQHYNDKNLDNIRFVSCYISFYWF